jgi:hypothetical protein
MFAIIATMKFLCSKSLEELQQVFTNGYAKLHQEIDHHIKLNICKHDKVISSHK